MMRSSPAPAMRTPATTILTFCRFQLRVSPPLSSMSHATAIQMPAIKRSRNETSATVTLALWEKARSGPTVGVYAFPVGLLIAFGQQRVDSLRQLFWGDIQLGQDSLCRLIFLFEKCGE